MNPNHEPQADIPSTYRFRFPLSSFINSTSSDGSYMPVLDLVQGSVTAVSFTIMIQEHSLVKSLESRVPSNEQSARCSLHFMVIMRKYSASLLNTLDSRLNASCRLVIWVAITVT